MGVKRRADRKNRWYFEFEVGAERHRGVCRTPDGQYAKTKAQANDAEAAIRKAVLAEQPRLGLAPDRITLMEALALHIKHNSADSTDSHLASLERISEEMIGFFGAGRAIVDITANDIAAYRNFLVAQKRRVWIGGQRKMDRGNPRLWKTTDKTRSKSEVNHCLDVLRVALRRAERTSNGLLPPVPEVESVDDEKRAPSPMPVAELEARLAVAAPWVVDAALLARYFGCRLGEALALDLHHLDHERHCFRLSGAETKSGRDERLFGGETGWALALELAAQARRRGQTRLVTWPGQEWARRVSEGVMPADDATDPKTGASVWRPLNSIAKAWKATARRASIERPHRFHDLRAAFITDIARRSSSTVTKGLARHSSMDTTERYIKVAMDDLAEAAKLADRGRSKIRVVRSR